MSSFPPDFANFRSSPRKRWMFSWGMVLSWAEELWQCVNEGYDTKIKLDNKWTPIILCGGLAEIDRNRVTVLVNDVEELASLNLSEVTTELEKATLAVENAETSKAKLDTAIELKKATARVEALNYLS